MNKEEEVEDENVAKAEAGKPESASTSSAMYSSVDDDEDDDVDESDKGGDEDGGKEKNVNDAPKSNAESSNSDDSEQDQETVKPAINGKEKYLKEFKDNIYEARVFQMLRTRPSVPARICSKSSAPDWLPARTSLARRCPIPPTPPPTASTTPISQMWTTQTCPR